MDLDFWAQECKAAAGRSPSEIKQANSAVNAIAVSRFVQPDQRLCLSRRPQISICAFAAVPSATFFLLDYRLLRWRRIGKEVEGDRIWKNLRRFSGWMCAGCVTGIVAFASWMQSNAYLYESADPLISMSQQLNLRAAFYRYRAPFNVFYPVHLLCVIYATSTLLRRVSDHASHSHYNTVRDAVDVGDVEAGDAQLGTASHHRRNVAGCRVQQNFGSCTAAARVHKEVEHPLLL